MVGIGDLGDKAKDALNSEQGENINDKGLDAASDAASNVTGGKFDDQINQGRDAADEHVGQQGQQNDDKN